MFIGVYGLSEENGWGDGLQCSNLGGTAINDGSGSNSSTYATVEATLEMSGYSYRCIVTNNYGLSDTSNFATLTVKTTPSSSSTVASSSSSSEGNTPIQNRENSHNLSPLCTGVACTPQRTTTSKAPR